MRDAHKIIVLKGAEKLIFIYLVNEKIKRNTEEMPTIKSGGKTANDEMNKEQMQNDHRLRCDLSTQLVVCVWLVYTFSLVALNFVFFLSFLSGENTFLFGILVSVF